MIGVEIIFWFVIYAVTIIFLVWIFDKLNFKKKNSSQNKSNVRQWIEIINIEVKEYPLLVKNNYLLKLELTSRIFLLICFGIGLYFLGFIPLEDPLHEFSRKMGIATDFFGILWVLFSRFKMLIGLIKNKLFIKIYQDKITYDYITEKGELETRILAFGEIQRVNWSWFPYASAIKQENDDSKDKRDERLWGYVFLPLNLVFSLCVQIVYCLINYCHFSQYYILEDKREIISIPIGSLSKISEVVSFKWRSLISISSIFRGGYYGK